MGPRDWENPAVFNRNKCRSHVPLRAFPSQEAALQYYVSGPAPRDAPNVQVLNSDDWAFHLYDCPEKVPKGIQDPSFDDGQWGKASRASWSLIHRHSLCGAVIPLFQFSSMDSCHRINEGMRSHIPWENVGHVICADRGPRQLGMPGPLLSHLHQLPVSLAYHCPLRAGGQSHGVLPQAFHHTAFLEGQQVMPSLHGGPYLPRLQCHIM